MDGAGDDWESTLLEVVPQCQSVLMADLDQDGDLDIAAVTVLKDYIPIFLNDGTAQNWTRHEISPVTSPRLILDCDLNSDGALDLLVSSSAADTLLWMDDLCSYTGVIWNHPSFRSPSGFPIPPGGAPSPGMPRCPGAPPSVSP